MTDTAVYHNHPPALIPLYARALQAKSGKKDSPTIIPDLSARLMGAATSTKSLPRYQSICGFQTRRRIPATWPHILAFPLHLKLLTDNRFPLPLLGLVHLRNTITQHRDIACGENLDIDVRFGKQESTARGIEFDLITEAYSAGKLVWEESSVNLFRQADRTEGNPGEKVSPPKLERYPNTLSIDAAESIGRQYASVSGDRNPIHLHALTAKAFGFPRAIAHGMWSKAHVLALLEQQENWMSGAFRVSCQFKKPLFLPGTAQLNWQSGKSRWDYQLLNGTGDAPHLTGNVEWL
ncbi:hypothetical protein FWJ25_16810 [Marinobacter salinexigens]|uniref:MaoC-like domain-containing protein n=1 Tax=Marinobacter salinexigens TaxID=2919747 RepID=A0A5B0VAS0_9GAMM|nr:MaoC/PaaZ C-terminal domain-containing protein [Marinobacter salinexigens]KAA1171283.1 hypothetical protein FWJ25_16810 [Marinobacter salinexigens]